MNSLYYHNNWIFMYKYSMLPEMCDNFFTKLKIHTHIVHVNPHQNIYMWISEVLQEDKAPAYIAVQSPGISYWTTLTLCAIGSFKRQSRALFLTSLVDLFKWNLLFINDTTAHLVIKPYCFMVNRLPCAPGPINISEYFLRLITHWSLSYYSTNRSMANARSYHQNFTPSPICCYLHPIRYIVLPDIGAYKLWLPAPFAKSLW